MPPATEVEMPEIGATVTADTAEGMEIAIDGETGTAMDATIVIIAAMSVIGCRLTTTLSRTARLVIPITIRTTALALTIAATTTGSTPAPTTHAVDRHTIPNALTFTRVALAAIVPAKAVALRTRWHTAMVFYADIAKAIRTGRNIL